MKKLILIIIVGCVFGDTITYKESLLLDKTKVHVEFLGVSDKKVYFKDVNNNIDFVVCKTVKEILNSDGNVINIDCSSNAYTPPKESSFSQSKEKAKRKAVQYNTRISHKIGGGLIAVGGLLLYNTLDRAECESCVTPAEFANRLDSVKIQSKIGYAFIMLGGLIIAIGI